MNNIPDMENLLFQKYVISLTPLGQQLFLKAVIPEPTRQQKEAKGSFTSLTSKYKIYVCAYVFYRCRQTQTSCQRSCKT